MRNTRDVRWIIGLVGAGLLIVLLGVIAVTRRVPSIKGTDTGLNALLQPLTGTDTASSVGVIRHDVDVSVEAKPASREEGAPSPSIRMLFVGDIMLDRNVKTRMQTARDLAYPFRKLPPGWIASFDYAVANLEGPVTALRRPPVKSIDFQFDPEVVPMLKAQGFDAFSQANNHALDQGTPGYQDSISLLRKEGFLVFGHQVQDDEIALATTTIQGKKFAFLGWNNTDNPIDKKDAAKAIVAARAEADYVIAVLHWGAEYQDHPLASVVDLSHWFVDQGVDVVMGGHPHWVQGIYSYKGRPIVYSLGNFVFDQDWSRKTKQGLAIELTIQDKELSFMPVPVDINLSQPAFVAVSDLPSRLNALAQISEEGLRAQIVSGTVRFTLP